jgi:hypothetical protein
VLNHIHADYTPSKGRERRKRETEKGGRESVLLLVEQKLKIKGEGGRQRKVYLSSGQFCKELG